MIAKIDNFDRLEETHDGAVVGKVLQYLEDRIIEGPCCRDMLRRLGEGKFAVVPTPNTRVCVSQMGKLAHAIETLVAQPIFVEGHTIYLTASIGYAAQSHITEPTGTQLLDAAGLALRTAQSKTTASTCAFDESMKDLLETRESRLVAIKDALGSGAIYPFFQPQVCMNTNNVIGFEALARWKHPSQGMIPPVDFLSQLEEFGMMQEFGLLMIRYALDSLQDWHKAGFPVPTVSVNFSTEELRNPNLPTFVAMELERNGLSADCLVVEVLETVVADDRSLSIQKNLKLLSDMGCHLDLDDFGTGNASITTIRTFCVDRIKIDRSFISHSNHDLQKQQMIEAIIAISGKLAVGILAEGVETKDELAFLQTANCDHVQGYLIAPPMPRHDVTTWLKNWYDDVGGRFRRPDLSAAG